MPLPPSTVARKELHTRKLEMRGFAREDGLFDIEGHLLDTKPYLFTVVAGPTKQPDDPIHHMFIRITIDDRFLVKDIVARSDAAPFGSCFEAPDTLRRLIGVSMASGWSREVRQRLAGSQSCTHLMEMLMPLATVAFQALVVPRRKYPVPLGADGRPVAIDSCYAMAADREVVAIRWPEHYTGPRSGN